MSARAQWILQCCLESLVYWPLVGQAYHVSLKKAIAVSKSRRAAHRVTFGGKLDFFIRAIIPTLPWTRAKAFRGGVKNLP